MTNPRRVGTGTSYGAIAHDDHARVAVEKAIAQIPNETIGSVLLFLTTGYAHKPQMAIKEAAKTAATPSVFGCCAMSLLNDEEWLLDVEGAVAMVFPRALALQPLKVLEQQGVDPAMVLTLSTPNAATIAVNSSKRPQFGSITTDEYGHGPYSVWQSGRIVEQEYVQASFPNHLEHAVATSAGVRRISPIMQINRAETHKLIEIDQSLALDNLLSNLPENLHAVGLKQPYNLLCAISENSDPKSIQNGHYKLHHIVSSDEKSNTVYLSGSVKAGRRMFWALLDEELAQVTMKQTLEGLKGKLSKPPLFGLMFPNIGRGPEFYNGRDRDLELFREIFPNTPLLGFYGNGEIAPGHKLAGLIHRHTNVISLFT